MRLRWIGQLGLNIPVNLEGHIRTEARKDAGVTPPHVFRFILRSNLETHRFREAGDAIESERIETAWPSLPIMNPSLPIMKPEPKENPYWAPLMPHKPIAKPGAKPEAILIDLKLDKPEIKAEAKQMLRRPIVKPEIKPEAKQMPRKPIAKPEAKPLVKPEVKHEVMPEAKKMNKKQLRRLYIDRNQQRSLSGKRFFIVPLPGPRPRPGAKHGPRKLVLGGPTHLKPSTSCCGGGGVDPLSCRPQLLRQ